MNPIEREACLKLAADIRINILEMLLCFGAGHAGGSLSIADVLAVLYETQMHIDPANPAMADRDQLVLSKGHAGPALYSVLAEKGFFSRSLLKQLNQGGTCLPSHPDRLKTPGVDMTTGSLGQGCSTAAGIALAQKKRGYDESRTYLICGDGELNEGQCWEAFQFLAARKLDNCIVLIDWNKKQLDGYVSEVMNPFSLEGKMQAFGFYTQTVDGQDVDALYEALTQARQRKGQPSCIILDTVKGAGVDFIEEMVNNHSIRFNSEEIQAKTRQAAALLKAYAAGKDRVCLH